MDDIKFMKVYRGTGNNYDKPRIQLQGKWLEEFGFTIGSKIIVKKEIGRIVIILMKCL